MKINTVLLGIVLASLSVTTGAAQQSFDDWRAERETRYHDFQKAFHARYQEYLERVTAEWGGAAVLSDANRVVRYSDNLQHRVIVDYENLTIDIDFIDGTEPVRSDMQQALEQLSHLSVADAARQDPVLQLSSMEDQRPLLETFTGGKAIEMEALAPTDLTTTKLSADVAASDPEADPTSKRISRITLNLADQDIFSQRAKTYQPAVNEFARLHDLAPALIFAIMQVESSFNPLAQSHIPAFGLMQVVPNSAGVDVNRALFSVNEPPSSQLLFQPKTNIQFGSKYLDILSTKYLTGILDPEVRQLCIIAAYNTGAGNVASVFHPQGRRQIRPAVEVINTLTVEEVYAKLLSDLPYQETRDYLPKVMDALKNYQSAEITATGTI